jgi:hypothetical protein
MANYGSIGVYKPSSKRNTLSVNTSLVITNGFKNNIGFSVNTIQRRSMLGLAKSVKKSMTVVSIPNIGTIVRKQNLIKRIPLWAYSAAKLFPDTTGKLEGTVKVEGVLWENVMVRLYYKENGFLIDTTYTDSLGRFSFIYLETGNPNYTVIAYRNTFNAIVLDGVAPVKM